jgi:hypothetical protein
VRPKTELVVSLLWPLHRRQKECRLDVLCVALADFLCFQFGHFCLNKGAVPLPTLIKFVPPPAKMPGGIINLCFSGSYEELIWSSSTTLAKINLKRGKREFCRHRWSLGNIRWGQNNNRLGTENLVGQKEAKDI